MRAVSSVWLGVWYYETLGQFALIISRNPGRRNELSDTRIPSSYGTKQSELHRGDPLLQVAKRARISRASPLPLSGDRSKAVMVMVIVRVLLDNTPDPLIVITYFLSFRPIAINKQAPIKPAIK